MRCRQWNRPGLRLDQAARDQGYDVLASLRIDPLTFEGEIRTVTGDAVNHLGDIVFGAVELPEPERLDRGAGIGVKWTYVVRSPVDEQAQASCPESGAGRPAGTESRIVVETRESVCRVVIKITQKLSIQCGAGLHASGSDSLAFPIRIIRTMYINRTLNALRNSNEL